MKFVGLDGYPRGWVAVWLSDAAQRIEYFRELSDLLERDFVVAMIDMPIGMPEAGYRECDKAARQLLAPNYSRVFLGARRSFLDCETHSEANARAKSRDGIGVSAQLFGIIKKLNEVDRVVAGHQDRIMECHPELVFWRLNGCSPLPSKKTPAGKEIRKRLLEDNGFRILDEWIKTKVATAKTDDIFDACACAVAAKDKSDNRPPLGGDKDSKKLRMEINY